MSLDTIRPVPTTPKVVRFQINYNLKSLFLQYAHEKDLGSYQEFLIYLKSLGSEIRDDDLLQFLREARECISILSAKFKLFVELILLYQWAHRSEEVVTEYKGFLLDLCSAHCDYVKPVLEHLVNYFKSDGGDWTENGPGEKSRSSSKHLQDVIASILHVIPMSKEIFLNTVKRSYPYLKRPTAEQQSYVYNLLQIIQVEPSLQFDILSIIVDKLIILDSHCPRSELEEKLEQIDESITSMEVDGVFEMEESSGSLKTAVTTTTELKPVATTTIGDSLDSCLCLVYRFIWSESHDSEGKLVLNRLQLLYKDLIKIFDNVILQTHKTNHVQFLVFYLLSQRPALGVLFIESLWRKVSDVSLPPVIRQAAVSYMASFITRATFLSIGTIKETISMMASWIHSYINSEDGPNKSGLNDIKIHGVFYTTCQALFYIIAFLHKDLVQGNGLNLLQSLSLSKMVTCRLNPLRVCIPDVVKNFSSVSRSYQLAYCNTVIERNSRSVLPTVQLTSSGTLSTAVQPHLEPFFPFDPYLLPRSKSYITPIYRVYSGPSEDRVKSQLTTQDEDEDDFLEAASSPSTQRQSALDKFTYSSSPGFIHV